MVGMSRSVERGYVVLCCIQVGIWYIHRWHSPAIPYTYAKQRGCCLLMIVRSIERCTVREYWFLLHLTLSFILMSAPCSTKNRTVSTASARCRAVLPCCKTTSCATTKHAQRVRWDCGYSLKWWRGFVGLCSSGHPRCTSTHFPDSLQALLDKVAVPFRWKLILLWQFTSQIITTSSATVHLWIWTQIFLHI